MSEEFDKEELEKQMYDKNIQELQGEEGIGKLLVFNLENFAYRYIETSKYKEIKCQKMAQNYYVESIEPDVVNALKMASSELKPKLIELCKQHPGPESKKIQVKYWIGTKIDNDKQVTCFASISWDFPEFKNKEKCLYKEEVFKFDDPMLLRNKHAAILENVCTLF